jgi:AhpD family alkylhydroperoxidase
MKVSSTEMRNATRKYILFAALMEVQQSHPVWKCPSHTQCGRGRLARERFAPEKSPPASAGWALATVRRKHSPPRTVCYLFFMTTDRKEPAYLFTDKQISDKSELARRFLDARTRLNENVDQADNFLVKRFYNLDHNTYLEGALPAKYKELMGLVASACLRCDDCINYHIIQSYRLGVSRAEQEEAINVALVVGGSIVIPHLRRAYELLTELYSG